MPELRQTWTSAKRIDIHNHVRDRRRGSGGLSGELDTAHADALLARSQKLGIDCLCISTPLNTEAPTPDQVRAANDVVLEAMAHSERFLGFCFLNPGYARESLDEMDRCIVDGGMVGVKLYNQYVVCDPTQSQVMGRAAEMGVPVLMHAGKLMDAETRARQPRISDASHFVKAAAMYPETTLIQGHIGGGGDWEWNLRVLEEAPANVHIDTSGSVIDAGIVDCTVAVMGPERVLFATDGILEEGVGKVLEAELSDGDRDQVFAGTARRLLSQRRVP